MKSDDENTFPSKPDYGTDIDVLTTFHTLPKRFMAWDKDNEQWLFDGKVFTIMDFINEFRNTPLALDYFTICQSTGLFDKNDEEIFEGSIIRICRNYGYGFLPKNAVGAVYFDERQLCYKISGMGDYRLTSAKQVEVVGHILSNPDLIRGWSE